MDNFFSMFSKLNDRAQDKILDTNSTSVASPVYTPIDIKTITFTFLSLTLYFVCCLTIIISSVQLGLSRQSVCFFTLGITYTIISISLSTKSTIFLLLEILTGASIIELLAKLNYEIAAWFLVFILPIITIAQSAYFLLFYLH